MEQEIGEEARKRETLGRRVFRQDSSGHMTVDEENSIYVGGLPYDCNEAKLRDVFNIYGAVISVKIINDRKVGGKCYGFITFTNPRSAEDAIKDMDGRKIGGRVVRVNEVRARGGRPDVYRENFRRDAGREGDWDRRRERERDFDYDREYYRDRSYDRSRDRDRDKERDYDHAHDLDVARDNSIDHDRDHKDHDQESLHGYDRDVDRDQDMDWDNEKDIDKLRHNDSNREKEQHPRNRTSGSHPKRRESKYLSSDSSEGYHDQLRDRLEKLMEKQDEIQNEIALIKEKVGEKQENISELLKKSKRLEDALASAQKLKHYRRSILTEVHGCLQDWEDSCEKVKISEKKFLYLSDKAKAAITQDEDTALKDVLPYANGQM